MGFDSKTVLFRARAEVVLSSGLRLLMSFSWPVFPGLDQVLFPSWFSWFLGFDSKTVHFSRGWTRFFSPEGFSWFLGFVSKTIQRSAFCRSRRELSNAYLQLLATSCNIWLRYNREQYRVQCYFLFVPLRYLQFLRIVRFTSQPANRERTLQSLAELWPEFCNFGFHASPEAGKHIFRLLADSAPPSLQHFG